MRTEIIYEDDDVLVVYKPAGLATQTASVGCQDVVSELKNYIRQTEVRAGKNVRSVPYLGVIHRLDQPVEGLLVFAKNPKAASGLSAQLRKQEEETGFCKHYYAVLYGRPVETSGELADYLCKKDGRAEIVECCSERQEALGHDVAGRAGKDRKTEEAEKMRKKRDDTEAVSKRRKARLQYCILQTVDISEIAPAGIRNEPGGLNQGGAWTAQDRITPEDVGTGPGRSHQSHARMTQDGIIPKDVGTGPGRPNQSHVRMTQDEIALADILLETGRFHQIRAQMAHGGMPLLGDLKYGSEESIEAGRKLNVRNVALCAYRLKFVHPVTGRKMDFHISPKGEVFSLFSQF